ncbi:ABC transporter substrate-binding protein [Pseudomonas typographi]|uniref:ABC transporter substrate-binding protein n=1 Tax=Pseudomonas typographi TaxID=2715964 RepID=A0ABR7Z565_9PSED|nr:ABC transporter substrate-binding protein [Pseudomonas typographi]MBD1586926.1 ABC transporter substrate-binding protein [Pseudomonas typographi]MBD1600615.1 ABC transporter substrate-binding protein [Pseudomonas typographi]
MKISSRLFLGFSSLIMLAASGFTEAETVLRVGISSDPDQLDPVTSRSYTGRFIFNALCDRLVDIDAHLNIVPGLATDWSWSADNQVLTMHLRQGVVFHDGEKFDAAAVKYNIERELTLPGSTRKSEISSISTVEVADPYTIVFNLKTPDAALLSQLTDRAGAMLAPEATAKGNVAAHPVCSGPYQFDSRVQQDRIVLTRFNQYWNPKPYHFDKVIFLPVPDASVRLANLRAGDLDLVDWIAASDVKTVTSDNNLMLAKPTPLGYMSVVFNIGHGQTTATSPLATDTRVRQAFSWGLDRDAINQVVFGGLYTPANQPFTDASPYHVERPIPPRDAAKARALLADAGITSPLHVTLMVPNDPVAQQVAQVIQSMEAEAGFDVSLQMTEHAMLLSRLSSGDFELALSSWSGRPDPDGDVYSFVATRGALNDGRYSNEQVDKWLLAARQSNDTSQRKALYTNVVQQLQADMPIAYLYFEPRMFAINKKVKGFSPYPDALLRLADVTFSQ